MIYMAITSDRSMLAYDDISFFSLSKVGLTIFFGSALLWAKAATLGGILSELFLSTIFGHHLNVNHFPSRCVLTLRFFLFSFLAPTFCAASNFGLQRWHSHQHLQRFVLQAAIGNLTPFMNVNDVYIYIWLQYTYKSWKFCRWPFWDGFSWPPRIGDKHDHALNHLVYMVYIYIYYIDISESDFFIYNPVIQAHRKFLRPKSGRLGRIVREKATAAPSYQPSYHGFSIVTCVFFVVFGFELRVFFVWGYKYILTLTTRMISIPRKIDCTYTPVICALGALWHCVWRFRWLLRPWNDHTDHQRRPCRVWKPCQWRGCHPQQVWSDWSCGRGIEVHLGDLNAKMFSPTKQDLHLGSFPVNFFVCHSLDLPPTQYQWQIIKV